MGRTATLPVVALAALALLLAACTTDEVAQEQPVAEADATTGHGMQELDENIERWGESEVTDYQMDIEFTCACDPGETGPFRIRVEGSKVLAIERLNDGDPNDSPPPMSVVTEPTIDQLFVVLALARDGDAEVTELEYDGERGFPRRVLIDPAGDELGDEYGWEILQLIVLPE